MDWLSTDPSRPGVFAIGQEAYGIFALGQMATGVIAIGQISRGVIAIGQVAVGVVAIGQAALGIAWAAAMIGVAGRGFGGVLRVFPKIRVERFERPALPPLSTLDEIERGDKDDGWIFARVQKTDRGPVLEVDGTWLALEETDEFRTQLAHAGATEHTHACVTVSAELRRPEGQGGGYREMAPSERVLIAKRMQSWIEAAPRAHLEGPLTGVGGLFLRGLGLFSLAIAYWLIAGQSVWELFAPYVK